MKFKMKSIASILVAAAMLATMAAPVFAVGDSGSDNRDEELAFYDSLSEQEKIATYDFLYKTNADGTLSPFRTLTRENVYEYERDSVPYVVNMKLGETIRITCSNYFSYSWKTNLVSSSIIQEPSETYSEDPNAVDLPSIYDFTAISIGTAVCKTQKASVGENYGGIIWNITEDGSALPDSEVTALSEKARADAAAKEAEEAAKWEALSQEEKDALAAKQEAEWAAEQAAAGEAPTTDAPVATPYAGGENYTVKAGDTFGLLSLNNYGSYNYADELYKANAAILKKSGGKIYKDLAIVIPETIAKGVNKLAPQEVYEGEKLYTVKSGDTLGTIAKATYSNANKYKAIFERNSDRLKNANTIYAGQVIVLP